MTRLRTCLVWTVLMVAVVLVPERLYAQATAGIPEKILAYPEMIVFNGKIATMDEKTSTVQAMAVRNGRILARGTDAEIRKLAGPRTQMIDAKGRTVLPGLMDIHSHPHLWLVNHLGTDQEFIVDPQLKLILVEGTTPAEIQKAADTALRKRVAEIGPGKWIILKLPRDDSGGDLSRGAIRVEDLDKAAPDNPVFAAVNINVSLLNSKAKEIVQARFGNNDLPGQTLWYLVVYDNILRGKRSATKDLITTELLLYAKQGITTVGTNVESPELMNVLNQMDRKGEMPVRWGTIHHTAYWIAKDPAEWYRLLGDFSGQGTDYLWSLGAGAETWYSGGADCTKAVPKGTTGPHVPSCDKIGPGNRGYNAFLSIIESGLRLGNVHGGSNDGVLDLLFGMIETAIREGAVTLDQIREQRLYIDHGNLIRPDQIPLLKKYNISLTMQEGISGGPALEKKYGAEYLKWLEPAKSLLEGGVRLGVSTDVPMAATPPQFRISSAKVGVWPILEALITREYDGRVWVPEERLDRITTLRSITTNAAWLFFREKELGSLEEGKLADFIIIDKDYFTIPEKEIHTIKPLLTVVGGKVVYRSSEF